MDRSKEKMKSVMEALDIKKKMTLEILDLIHKDLCDGKVFGFSTFEFHVGNTKFSINLKSANVYRVRKKLSLLTVNAWKEKT